MSMKLTQETLREDITATVEQGAAGAEPWVVIDNWTPVLRPDENLNDSDKSFTVGADVEEQVLWIWIELTTTATVGDRQIVVQLQDDGADVIGEWRVGQVQAASLTRYYCLAPSNADHLAFRDTDYLMTPFPPSVILPASYVVRVYDNNAVDAAADDMIVQMMVARRAV